MTTVGVPCNRLPCKVLYNQQEHCHHSFEISATKASNHLRRCKIKPKDWYTWTNTPGGSCCAHMEPERSGLTWYISKLKRLRSGPPRHHTLYTPWLCSWLISDWQWSFCLTPPLQETGKNLNLLATFSKNYRCDFNVHAWRASSNVLHLIDMS